MNIRLGCRRRKYLPTNSGRAVEARAALPPRPADAHAPAAFPFDHPPQSLMARRAAKPLAGAAAGARKPLFASRTRAAKKFEFTPWALTLAGLRFAPAGRFRCHRECLLGRLPTFGAPTAIPLALSLAVCPSLERLAILPAGTSAPPSPSGRSALRAAIAGLGVGGPKPLLTPLEKTTPVTRPTGPLTGSRFAATWFWAQGSCELPTAKPRRRSPSLRSEVPLAINSALVAVRHSPA
jgi:hypothetical protein